MAINGEQGPGGPDAPEKDGPLGRAVAALGVALDDLSAAPRLSASPAELGEALASVTRIAARLTSVQLGLVADAERCEVGADDGVTAASWWAHETKLTRPAARSAARLAAAVDPDTGRCPVVGRALAMGQLLEQQARVIVSALDALPSDLNASIRRHAEQVLTDLAAHHDAAELRRLGQAVLEQVAPDVAEEHERQKLDEDERRAWDQVRFSMTVDGNGMARGSFTLPEAQGQMLRRMVMAFAHARYRGDASHDDGPRARPAEERSPAASGSSGRRARPAPTDVDVPASGDHRAAHTGREVHSDPPERVPEPPDEPVARGADPPGPSWWDRPPAQRMGEAFAHLVERFDRDSLPTHGGVSPTVVVALTLSQLTGRGEGSEAAVSLDDGTRVSAGQARRWACTAGLIPVVLGTGSVALDMGRRARYFTPQQRLALALRDGGCTAVGCDLPPSLCDAHHMTPWCPDGLSDLANGRLLCGRHHRLMHDTGFDHEVRADGRVVFSRRTRTFGIEAEQLSLAGIN